MFILFEIVSGVLPGLCVFSQCLLCCYVVFSMFKLLLVVQFFSQCAYCFFMLCSQCFNMFCFPCFMVCLCAVSMFIMFLMCSPCLYCFKKVFSMMILLFNTVVSMFIMLYLVFQFIMCLCLWYLRSAFRFSSPLSFSL